eukprot:GHUV01042017.1.p1 GENE.GHUV01042017.1~~GHUV01042017.1.p1  ORF type:complete len:197 (+),score=33.42 GHUV01042017.1:786-1376(+)
MDGNNSMPHGVKTVYRVHASISHTLSCCTCICCTCIRCTCRYFDVNFFSSMRLSRHWLQGMLQRKQGRIIMISSEAGVRIIPDMLHYSITKQMQIGLGHGLAQLTKGTGVTVNTILPGPTWTEGVQGYIEGLAKKEGTSIEEATTNYFKQREPTSLIQRFIKPEEVAATALFLASEGAAAINGAAVRCEGGLVAHV